MKLTAQAVAKIAPTTARFDVKDDSTPGLYLRVHPTGAKTWRYRYKLADRVRVLTLGDAGTVSLADARRMAHEARAKVRQGEDPAAAAQIAAAERRRMPTVAEFADEYIERYAKLRKKSWDDDRRMLDRWVTPRIGRMKLDAVHRRDVVAVLDACRDAGNTRMPGAVLAVTRKMFRFAVERGVIESTPVIHVTERQPRPARKAMTPEQIRAWWQGSDAVPPRVMLALRLLLLTGQRPDEVAGLRVAEVDLDADAGPVWNIPAERRKNGRAHAVALVPEAVDIVTQAQALSDGSEYLFPSAIGGPGRVDSGLNRALRLGDDLDRFGHEHNRVRPAVLAPLGWMSKNRACICVEDNFAHPNAGYLARPLSGQQQQAQREHHPRRHRVAALPPGPDLFGRHRLLGRGWRSVTCMTGVDSITPRSTANLNILRVTASAAPGMRVLPASRQASSTATTSRLCTASSFMRPMRGVTHRSSMRRMSSHDFLRSLA